MTKEEFIQKWDRLNYTVQWTTGGLTGGSCYGDSADRPVEPEPEPELYTLDEILMEECPNLTFLEYRRMMRDDKLIVRRTWEDREYYGNFYAQASKQVDLDVLWPYIELVKNIPDAASRASHWALMKD